MLRHQLTIGLLLAIEIFTLGRALPSLGDQCYTNGVKGICKFYTDCANAKELFETREILPNACAFHTTNLVVCCVDEINLFKSKSAAKCKEYSASLYGSAEPYCESPMFGSHLILITDSPYLAELLYQRYDIKDGSAYYGIYTYGETGSLLSSRYVLSAALAVNITGRTIVQVEFGSSNSIRSVNNETSVKYNIEKIIIHPKHQSPSLYHDLALIKLSKKVEFSIYVHPICLPDTDIHPSVVNRVYYYIDKNYVYKTLSYENRPLMKFKRQTVSNERCNATYSNYYIPRGINDDFICTTSMELLDSDYQYAMTGEPITIDHPSISCSHLLLGVSTVTITTRIADIAIKVYNYREWIEGIIWADDEDL